MNITAEMVWQALLQDEDFLLLTELEQNALRPYAEAAPAALAAHLEREVTLVALFEARRSIVEAYLTNPNFVKDVIRSQNPTSSGQMRRLFGGFYSSQAQRMMEKIDEAVGDVDKMLERYEATEAEYLEDEVQLNDQALERYVAGGLTIGGLLMLHPWVLLHHKMDTFWGNRSR